MGGGGGGGSKTLADSQVSKLDEPDDEETRIGCIFTGCIFTSSFNCFYPRYRIGLFKDD